MNRWLIVSSITLLSVCIGVPPVLASDPQFDLMAGMRLTAEQAEALEQRLESDSHDLQARGQLIAYYHRNSFRDHVSADAHSKHVLWLIENAPQAGILSTPSGSIDPFRDADSYTAGKQLWSDHLGQDPTNVALLGNAANFFSSFQDRELVVETLKKAQSLDPDDSKWPRELGQLYLMDAISNDVVSQTVKELSKSLDVDGLDLPPGGVAELLGPDRPDGPTSATLALEQFQRAHDLADNDTERMSLLESLAGAAFLAQRYDDARAHATSMLNSESIGFNDQGRIHKANIILGRIALVEDDVALAKYHLLEAGKVSGSPTLSSFGPNMSLAAELLERGEQEVVLEYFELCSNFWSRPKLADWAAMVKGGRMPDFGGNLRY